MSWQFTKQIVINNTYTGGGVNTVTTGYGTKNIGTATNPIIVLDVIAGDQIDLSGGNPIKISENNISGQYLKTNAQLGISGTNVVTFDVPTSWTDLSNYIAMLTPSTFFVARSGEYRLSFQLYNLVGTANWNNNQNDRYVRIAILRQSVPAKFTIQESQMVHDSPGSDQYCVITGVVSLVKGDIIDCEFIQTLQMGNTSIEGGAGSPLDNQSSFTWELIKLL